MNSLTKQKLTYILNTLKNITDEIEYETKIIQSHHHLLKSNSPTVYTKDLLYEQLYLSDFLKDIDFQLSKLKTIKDSNM